MIYLSRNSVVYESETYDVAEMLTVSDFQEKRIEFNPFVGVTLC